MTKYVVLRESTYHSGDPNVVSIIETEEDANAILAAMPDDPSGDVSYYVRELTRQQIEWLEET